MKGARNNSKNSYRVECRVAVAQPEGRGEGCRGDTHGVLMAELSL